MSRSNKRHSEEYESKNTGSKHRDRSSSPKRVVTNIDETKKLKLSLTPVSKPKGIHIKLGGPRNALEAKPKVISQSVASAFNQDSDSEPEEMPPEAKMRMRNIGRDTPTSAGPNSFGKTKHGFCDAKKVFEKNLKEAMNNADRNDG